MNNFYSKFFSIVFRLIVGVIFIYASMDKIQNPDSFAISVENYQILSPFWSHYSALILPWLELYCGLFLLLGLFVRTSALMLAGMTFSFILALIYALYMNLDIDCGCFDVSGSSQKVNLMKILEDVVLLLMAAYIIKFPYEMFSIKNKGKG